MVVLLFICSVICVVGGAAAVGLGIPVKEFSFGNTLILGGIIAFVGGLIQFGLGLAVIHLQRIMDALSARPPVRVGRAMEPFDQLAPMAARPAQGRVPFPSRPSSSAPEAAAVSPPAPESVVPEAQVTPALRNPDEPPLVDEDADAPLSPQQSPAPAVGLPPENADQTRLAQTASAAEFSEDWRASAPATRSPQTTFFDDMWPAETPRVPRLAEEPQQQEQRMDVANEAKPFQAEPPMRAPTSDVHAVAILKSGVVDGMGYTLYVDGSIEAELPQGKLRFASINELRAHLERGS
ncbi:MAG: hypothetical protein WBD48_13805 [Pseudolabrys sp.]